MPDIVNVALRLEHPEQGVSADERIQQRAAEQKAAQGRVIVRLEL